MFAAGASIDSAFSSSADAPALLLQHLVCCNIWRGHTTLRPTQATPSVAGKRPNFLGNRIIQARCLSLDGRSVLSVLSSGMEEAMADGAVVSEVGRCREDGQRLFTVAEFYRLGEVGIIGPDERVELVDGVIYEMAPINPRHAAAVEELADALRVALVGRARVRTQNPVHLDDRNDPQPDVAVVVPRESGYWDRHPVPSEIHLLAEVADSTLQDDKRRKIPRYAQAGISEVWLVDLERGLVTVYRSPSPDGYLSKADTGQDGTLTLLAFPDASIPVARFTRKP
jgi:Uma2 family endonuclease